MSTFNSKLRLGNYKLIDVLLGKPYIRTKNDRQLELLLIHSNFIGELYISFHLSFVMIF